MAWRPPTGVNAKRMRFYRRNFGRTTAGKVAAAEAMKAARKFLRLRRAAFIAIIAGAAAAAGAAWWAVLR